MACGGLYTPPEGAVRGFLAHYRLPMSAALAAEYVAAWTAPGDLVLDPFCHDLTVARAAQAQGRRALAATGNPVLALLLRVEAMPPDGGALRAARQRLAEAPKGDQPLGAALDALFATNCGGCGAGIAAEAFLWEHGASVPVQQEVLCPGCGRSAREAVAASAAVPPSVDPLGFHYRLVRARLRGAESHERLERKLLALYTPRALYALTAILLKIELLYAESPLLDPLRACLLEAMGACSKLHLPTEDGTRPVRALEVPRSYCETNPWHAFQKAVEVLAARPRGETLVLARSLDEALQGAPGVYLGAEGLGHLTAQIGGRVRLAVSHLPRFDPTFAALSWLWSGWLWGQEGARTARHLLQQRAPQEGRYLRALQKALKVIGASLVPEGRLVLFWQAPATRYLETIYAALGMAGMNLLEAWHGVLDDRPAESFAARRMEHHVVVGGPCSALRGPWPVASGSAEAVLDSMATRAREVAVAAACKTLRQRGEPAPFGALHGPIWDALAREGLLAGVPRAEEAEARRLALQTAVQQGLQASLGGELEQVSAVGERQRVLWRATSAGVIPLSERVEACLRRLLAEGVESEGALQRAVNALEGGPPAWPWVQACLQSYAVAKGSGCWALAVEESEAAWQAWRERVLAALDALATRLGYMVAAADGQQPGLPGLATAAMEWREASIVAWRFHLCETTQIAGLRRVEQGRGAVVIPERRVGLWRHRLAGDPGLESALAATGWALLREAAIATIASRGEMAAALGLAGGRESGQLALFGG